MLTVYMRIVEELGDTVAPDALPGEGDGKGDKNGDGEEEPSVTLPACDIYANPYNPCEA